MQSMATASTRRRSGEVATAVPWRVEHGSAVLCSLLHRRQSRRNLPRHSRGHFAYGGISACFLNFRYKTPRPPRACPVGESDRGSRTSRALFFPRPLALSYRGGGGKREGNARLLPQQCRTGLDDPERLLVCRAVLVGNRGEARAQLGPLEAQFRPACRSRDISHSACRTPAAPRP